MVNIRFILICSIAIIAILIPFFIVNYQQHSQQDQTTNTPSQHPSPSSNQPHQSPIPPLPLLVPHVCTTYDRYLSHLSTKTPYSYRHPAYPSIHCHSLSDESKYESYANIDENQYEGAYHGDLDTTQLSEPCFGPTCPLQFSLLTTNDPIKQPQLQCKLKHISHLNRHGTRNPTKPGQINKTAQLILDAQQLNGLIANVPVDDLQRPITSWVVDGNDHNSAVNNSNSDSNNTSNHGSMDDLFRPENGGDVADIGRLELYGIGDRLRTRMDITNFNPQQLIGSTTFKQRTVQSLLALLCGLGMYDMGDVRTPTSVSDRPIITIDGVEYKQPFVHVKMPMQLLLELATIQMKPIDEQNGSDKARITLAIIHEFEHQFITQIGIHYPLHKHPLGVPLSVSVYFNRHQQLFQSYGDDDNNNEDFEQCIHLTIPANPTTGLSSLVDLYLRREDKLTTTPIPMTDISSLKNQIKNTKINKDNINPKSKTRNDLIVLPDEYFHTDHSYSTQWNNAVLRYFDECGSYDVHTSKRPKSWTSFLESYTDDICGIGTHCDVALHRIFTDNYLQQHLLQKRRYTTLIDAVGDIIKGVQNKNDIDLNKVVKAIINENATVDEKWLLQLLQDAFTNNNDNAKENKGKKEKAGKKDKKEDKKDKGSKIFFPSQFNPTISSIKQLYESILKQLHKSSHPAEELLTLGKFQKSLLSNDALTKSTIIKKLYGLCSLQMSVHSSPEDSTTIIKNEFKPQISQFCQVLGSTHYDTIVTDLHEYKLHHTQIEYDTYIQQIYNQLATTTTYTKEQVQLPPHGSPIFYNYEYLTDIAQLAKKGAFESITLGSACVLLENLLPTFDQNDSNDSNTFKTSMNVYGAHAETLLPLMALITGNPQLATNRPPIPKPVITDLNDPKYISSPEHIYSMDTLLPRTFISSGSHFLDGLHNMTYQYKDDTMINPAWRSSFHTPMGGNVGVHIYECEPILNYDTTTQTDSNTTSIKNIKNEPILYAQLLLNEEVIPWPEDITSENIIGKTTHYFTNETPPKTNKPYSISSPSQHSILLPWLRQYDSIKAYFIKKYETLGMGQCNIKDWNLACHVDGFTRKDAADDD